MLWADRWRRLRCPKQYGEGRGVFFPEKAGTTGSTIILRPSQAASDSWMAEAREEIPLCGSEDVAEARADAYPLHEQRDMSPPVTCRGR